MRSFLYRNFGPVFLILTGLFLSYRMATNRLITIAIITVLVLLIIGVIYSKFH